MAWAAAGPSLSDRERLACYDALASDTPPATEPPATISAESLFGRDAAQTSAVLQQQTGISTPQILDAEISSVETRADGKLLLSLQNDQRWEQIDGRPLDLAAGRSGPDSQRRLRLVPAV